jgi:response regulator RpfG family c-di-GMP phosphodiesterase
MQRGDEHIRTEVLFVDDEEYILKALARLFMDEDFVLRTATSGPMGLRLLGESGAVGVVVSDQRMPGMSGVEFLTRVKELRPDTLRLLMTGFGDLATVKDAVNKGGACRYITKPWVDEELVQIVREAVIHFELARDNRRMAEVIRAQNARLKDWNSQLEIMVQEQTIELTRQNDRLKALIERQDNTIKGVISALSGLMELRDHRARNHSRNVAELACGIARSMKLSPGEVEVIFVASLLHDIGLIGVPDDMLLKDYSMMSEAEQAEYRLHPIRGQAAIEGIEDLRAVAPLIRHHHERYDGTGYPDRIAGDEIPLGSRIIAIADHIDNNTGLLKPKALELELEDLRQRLKTQFDPKVFVHTPQVVRSFMEGIASRGDESEIELLPHELKPGMMVSRNVISGTGVLLISRGVRLTEKNVETLRRIHRIDPSKEGIFVWVNR